MQVQQMMQQMMQNPAMLQQVRSAVGRRWQPESPTFPTVRCTDEVPHCVADDGGGPDVVQLCCNVLRGVARCCNVLLQMMAANPMAQQMMQRNPQAAAMLQNPALLQQARRRTVQHVPTE